MIHFIDDDDDDLFLIHKAITECQYLTFTQHNNAADFLQQQTINADDLYVIDLNMPNINGDSLLHKLQQQQADSRVAVLTTSDNPSDKQHFLQQGALEYFVKPNSFNELKLIMQQIIQLAEKEDRRA